MSLARRAVGVLGANLTAAALAATAQVIVTRGLSVSDRGFYEAVTATAALAAAVASLSLPNATIFQLRSRPADERRGIVLEAALMGGLLIVVVVGAVTVGAEFVAEEILAGAPRSAALLGAVLTGTTMAALIISAVCRGTSRFDLFARQRILDAALTVAVLAGGLGLLDGDLELALAAPIAGAGLAASGVAGPALRGLAGPARVRGRRLVSSLRYGSLSWSQGLAGMVNERIDVVLLAVLGAGTGELARYGVAVAAARVIRLIAEAIGIAVFPELVGGDRTSSSGLAARACRTSIGGTLVGAAGAVATAPWVLPGVFGPEYRASVGLLAVLAVASLPLAAYRILGRYFMGADIHRVGIGAQVTAAGVNVALNLALIPDHGARGAAVATLVSYSVSAVLITVAFRRRTGLGYSEVLVARRSDLAALRAGISS